MNREIFKSSRLRNQLPSKDTRRRNIRGKINEIARENKTNVWETKCLRDNLDMLKEKPCPFSFFSFEIFSGTLDNFRADQRCLHESSNGRAGESDQGSEETRTSDLEPSGEPERVQRGVEIPPDHRDGQRKQTQRLLQTRYAFYAF